MLLRDGRSTAERDESVRSALAAGLGWRPPGSLSHPLLPPQPFFLQSSRKSPQGRFGPGEQGPPQCCVTQGVQLSLSVPLPARRGPRPRTLLPACPSPSQLAPAGPICEAGVWMGSDLHPSVSGIWDGAGASTAIRSGWRGLDCSRATWPSPHPLCHTAGLSLGAKAGRWPHIPGEMLWFLAPR